MGGDSHSRAHIVILPTDDWTTIPAYLRWADREGVGTWERARGSGRLFGILRTIMLRIGHNTDI
jgi:hypothetical protein